MRELALQNNPLLRITRNVSSILNVLQTAGLAIEHREDAGVWGRGTIQLGGPLEDHAALEAQGVQEAASPFARALLRRHHLSWEMDCPDECADLEDGRVAEASDACRAFGGLVVVVVRGAERDGLVG